MTRSNTNAFIADIIAIAVFALLARIAHQSATMPLNFLGWLSTLWPFVIGVVLAWCFIYFKSLDGRIMAPSGVGVWLTTVVVGLFIWGIRHGRFPHWSFILVASISSAILLFGWRAVAQWRAKRG